VGRETVFQPTCIYGKPSFKTADSRGGQLVGLSIETRDPRKRLRNDDNVSVVVVSYSAHQEKNLMTSHKILTPRL